MRREKVVRVPAWEGNRDAGKLFKITEASAERAEQWGIRMLLLASGSGVQMPMDMTSRGLEGIAIIGWNVILSSIIDPAKFIPLFDELLDCVDMIRDPRHPDVVTKLVSPDDVEEVRTRLWLRSEVLELHLGFSPAAALSAFISAIQKPKEEVGGQST